MPELLSEHRDGVLTLTLNRPEKANAFSMEMVAALRDAFREAARDASVRCVVVTGTGHVFGAGHDAEEMLRYMGTTSYRAHLLETYNPLILQIRRLEKPVIAAINGPCAGASLGIALACDMRIAAQTARFVVGFSRLGLVPDSGVSILLPRLIGLGRAMEFTLTNAPISADQALEWGLVNRVVPPEALQEETAQLAARLAAGPIGAYALIKRAFNKTVLPDLEEALDYEAHLQEIASKSEEHRRGVEEFLRKRK
ncbi:MAG: 2-(1,2-epoxy-1,2-dihydrophenyl)acetyl-CoA isomerase [Anaerolineae bacterium]|nr:MAG: 2-(1,2-epoxy-1,2-dihydrophenyl)acetyl-CoA isomerase [Anaerolineae bacterium]